MIILDGGSSSGKTTLARALQEVLPGEGLTFGTDGEVTVGEAFRTLEAAWIAGLAATIRGGAQLVVAEVFLGGAASRRRWLTAFDGLDVLRVGVRGDGAVARARAEVVAARVRWATSSRPVPSPPPTRRTGSPWPPCRSR